MNQRSNERFNNRPREAEYANAADFCLVFERDMEPLYSLALWLTASRRSAEECFTEAFGECVRNSGVFKPWAKSWSRLAVIESAIRKLRPAAGRREHTAGGDAVGQVHPAALPVLRLNTFERFVYVLTVLDRYSIRDCALLLKCGRKDVEQARFAALNSIVPDGGRLPEPRTISAASVPGVAA